MAGWLVDCKIVIGNEPAVCVRLSLRILKRKLWLKAVLRRMFQSTTCKIKQGRSADQWKWGGALLQNE
jgi:hypothetical protein